tara:strand:+ start:60 stop:242 length:183 start_codon:yes stop_codon:yes gene_type:complete
MDKDMIMTDHEEKLLNRIKVLEKALQEIVDVASVSEGRSAAFYGMLAQKALERGKIERTV